MLSPTTLPPAQLGAAGSPSSARITRRWASRTAVRVRAAEGTPLTGLLGGLWPSASAASPAAAAPSPTTAAAPEALPGIEEGPALTDVFAEPLPGDGEDVAALRQLLAQTQLEGAPLRLAYEANRDGWSADAFHAKVDGTGPALVVALTVGGAVLGGYNPAGWAGQGVDTGAISAFLFVWPDGDVSDRPIKLPKAGGPAEAVTRDAPGEGIWFGRSSLAIPLRPGAERAVKGKLGAEYSRKPNSGRHIIGDEGSPVKGGARGTQLVDLRVYVAA